jgi:hypothetical protein
MEPKCFQQDLGVTIQTLVWEGPKYRKMPDDVASVAYWYQTLPHAPLPPLPSPKNRLAPVLPGPSMQNGTEQPVPGDQLLVDLLGTDMDTKTQTPR